MISVLCFMVPSSFSSVGVLCCVNVVRFGHGLLRLFNIITQKFCLGSVYCIVLCVLLIFTHVHIPILMNQGRGRQHGFRVEVVLRRGPRGRGDGLLHHVRSGRRCRRRKRNDL